MHGCFLKQRKGKKVKGRAEGYLLLKMKQIHCKAYMEIHVFTLGPLRLRAWIQSQTQQQEVLIVESSLRGRLHQALDLQLQAQLENVHQNAVKTQAQC